MASFVPRTNLPVREAFRWSIGVARRELSISAGSLKQRLADSNEAPATDGCYSSRQLFDACFGSLHKARLRQIEQEIEHTAVRTGILRADYVDKAAIEDLFGQLAEAIRGVINTSALTLEQKADIFQQLSGTKVRIAHVAALQRRGMNGEASGNGAQEPARRKRGRPRKVAEAKEVVPADG